MSVSVSFTRPVVPSRLLEVQALLESLETKVDEAWEVCISTQPDDELWILTICGPQHHRRVYPVYGPERGCHEPAYLCAIVRAEINAFPSSPPQDFALALAELTRLGIPYDDTGTFGGHVSVNGESMLIGRLAELYRQQRIESTFAGRDPKADSAASPDHS